MAYDLKPLKAPRSAGGLLRFLVWLAEGPLGGLLAKKFFTDIGIDAMRAAVAKEALPLEHRLLRAARQAKVEGGSPVETPPPTPGERPYETAGDFVSAYRDGALTPEDVAERVLAWSRESNEARPPLRSVIAQQEDAVMLLAKQSAERYREGAPLGPLDGVPVGVKDELDVAGYPTKVGTSFLGTRPASEDARVVSNLREAGALLIGKLNMHEIGLGVTGLNPHFGAARNPYDPTRATGGSSSGSAAAVGAGLCPLAVSADGGGSIRIPASLCGQVGLKATFGRISEHGAAPLCWSVAHVGPIAASARDAALGYLAMAGPDRRDPNTTAQPPVDLERFGEENLEGLRLGVFRPWFEHADRDIVAACDRVLTELAARGATVVDVTIPDLALLRTAHLVTIVSEMRASHRPHIERHRSAYNLDTRLNLALAGRMLGTDYVHAQRLRARFDHHFEKALRTADVLVTPTTACTAPILPNDALRSGESNLEVTDRIMRFAPAGNLTGLPAISCPAGYDHDGLPVGIQLMGRAWEEGLLLRLASVIESFVERRPAKVHRRLLG